MTRPDGTPIGMRLSISPPGSAGVNALAARLRAMKAAGELAWFEGPRHSDATDTAFVKLPLCTASVWLKTELG